MIKLKEIITNEKTAINVLPDMLKIAKDGDVLYKIAKLLIGRGWTDEDFHQEFMKEDTKTGYINSVFVNNLYNLFREMQRGSGQKFCLYKDLDKDFEYAIRDSKKKK